MATILNCSLPPVPSSFDISKPAVIKGSIAAPKKRDLELLGPKFQAFVRRRFHNRTHSEDEKIQKDIYGSGDVEVEDFSDDEVETPELARLDPRNWKEQDHYKVLGLSKYRYKATSAKIKAAFHKKVLRHHPDKKAAAGNTNDDAFFKCIQKAHEILTDPVKRRQFDSVDDYFPDTFPIRQGQG
ncbi:Zuotin [Entomophthora muscae]|uniref:Zuotin n=1 Tax=Entomophthora muscae TaxID=34485 RepID=A0ACC2U4B9_9FUNG|nr:Zuotin [Entomophthora muscae]